jgi:hypothetical protein
MQAALLSLIPAMSMAQTNTVDVQKWRQHYGSMQRTLLDAREVL